MKNTFRKLTLQFYILNKIMMSFHNKISLWSTNYSVLIRFSLLIHLQIKIEQTSNQIWSNYPYLFIYLFIC